MTCRANACSPFMHPGNRALKAFSKSSSDIQRPSWLRPLLGMGTVSLCSRVTMTVLLSILATSLGSVRANQLQKSQGPLQSSTTRNRPVTPGHVPPPPSRTPSTLACCGSAVAKPARTPSQRGSRPPLRPLGLCGPGHSVKVLAPATREVLVHLFPRRPRRGRTRWLTSCGTCSAS